MRETSLNVDDHTVEVLELYLLGTFRARVGMQLLTDRHWRLRKATVLVQILALTPGFQLHRDQLTDLLWPDAPFDAALNNLYQTLHIARRTLGSLFTDDSRPRLLEIDHHVITLGAADRIWTDVSQFELLHQRALVSDTIADHQAAIRLYRGDLLPDDPYIDQFASHRQALRGKYHSLLFRLAQLYVAEGRSGNAVATLEHILANDRTQEDAHVQLMQLYARAGLRYQALAQYDALSEALSAELDSQPQPSTTKLRDQIRTGRYGRRASEGDERSMLSGEPDQPGERVSQPDAGLAPLIIRQGDLISREREIEELVLLLSVSRFLTLSGPGGIGKTRLAIEIGHRMAHAFPDGVHLVQLAPVPEPELVKHQVAQSLGVRETATEPVVDTIARDIGEREMLLILDNFEHVTRAGSDVVALLTMCPYLKIMLTSRRRLRLPGEQEFVVPPLSVPGEHNLQSVRAVAEAGAVRLFVERARKSGADITLSKATAPPIARIVRQLDGLPLAIELAAARTRLLTPAEILSRLNRPLDVLSGGGSDQPARLQTLRNTIGWSYDLLEPGEQEVFQQLAIFVGGWTVDAAEAVVAVPDARTPVLDVLESLLDHHLIQQQALPGTRRLFMLETVREFALEQVAGTQLQIETQRRHARYFACLSERVAPELTGPDQDVWLSALDDEMGNLRTALDTCLRHSELLDTGMRIAGSLWLFWDIRGHIAESRRWLTALLAQAPPVGNSYAACCFALGYLATRQGDSETALPRLEEALALYQELGDRNGEARTLGMLGALASFHGDFEQSTALLEQALDVFRSVDDGIGIARTLLDLGDQVRVEGNYARARQLLGESLQRLRTLGFERAAGWSLANLGNTARAEGDDSLAASYFEESRDVFSSLGDKRGLSRPVLYLANLARRQGDTQTACALFRESLKLLQDIEDRWRLPVWVYYVGLLAVDCQEHATGTRLLTAAHASSSTFETLLDPAERDEGVTAMATAAAALDAHAARVARDSGARSSMDGAIRDALDLLSTLEAHL